MKCFDTPAPKEITENYWRFRFPLKPVYEGAVAQLRIAQWQRSVTRKHALLAQIYGLLKGEVDTARSLTLAKALQLAGLETASWIVSAGAVVSMAAVLLAVVTMVWVVGMHPVL